jgi:hypothetical protein
MDLLRAFSTQYIPLRAPSPVLLPKEMEPNFRMLGLPDIEDADSNPEFK